MEFEYTKRIIEIISQAEKTNKDNIILCANKFLDCIKQDTIIHTFGTGHSHMIGVEMFARAGGLGNVDAMVDPDTVTSFGARRSGAIEKTCGVADVIYDSYKINKGDIMIIISNSGRNAVPIEMAMRCKKEGIFVIAVTNLKQSMSQTSRHPSGKRLFELADIVLDTCVPQADAALDIDGIKTGPASNIVGMYLVDTISSLAIEHAKKQGITPYVFQSQNIDGFSNDEIYQHYDGRIKHF